MSKSKKSFICSECNYQSAKWLGNCPSCQHWNTFQKEESLKNKIHESSIDVKKINEVSIETFKRIKTNIYEFDRVVGDGLTIGSLNLIGGEPGVGKSTLLLTILQKYAESGLKILYISGEESESQIASRAKRLAVDHDNIDIINTNDWLSIKKVALRRKYQLLVVDSIQTIMSTEVSSQIGSVSQLKEITYEILNTTKENNLTTFLIGHITKEGNIAGPKLLEHMVDTVIYFENQDLSNYRILRTIKNRYGNTDEIGIFEMNEKGLKEVSSINGFLNYRKNKLGSALCCMREGTRNLLIEIQALTIKNSYGNIKRISQGIDGTRLSVITAIMEKYLKIPLSNYDIYITVTGGYCVNNNDADLAIITAIFSSIKNLKIGDFVFLGEVSLSGEVRKVGKIEKRINELRKLKLEGMVSAFENEDIHLRNIKNLVDLKNIITDIAA